jgi:ABC-type spermidine/putrescine transport system permease subunit I
MPREKKAFICTIIVILIGYFVAFYMTDPFMAKLVLFIVSFNLVMGWMIYNQMMVFLEMVERNR